MRIKIRAAGTATAAVLCLLVPSACGSSTDAKDDGDGAGSDKELTIGVEYNTLAVPFITALQRGIQDEAKKMGGIKLVERDAATKTDKQAADINELLAKNVDGLLVSGNGEAATLGALRPALAKKVPIVGNVSKIGTQAEAVPPDTSILAFVAQNEVSGGVEAAKLVQRALPDGGKYAIVLGATGYSENTTRVEGFTKELEGSGKTYTKVAEQPGDWVPEKGQSACQNMLAAQPDVELFYALSDDMGLGCIKAIKQAGSEALVVGVGGSKAGLAAVADGSMYGDVWYAPEDMGRLALKTLVEYLRDGTTPSPAYVETPIKAVTKDTVDSVTPQW